MILRTAPSSSFTREREKVLHSSSPMQRLNFLGSSLILHRPREVSRGHVTERWKKGQFQKVFHRWGRRQRNVFCLQFSVASGRRQRCAKKVPKLPTTSSSQESHHDHDISFRERRLRSRGKARRLESKKSLFSFSFMEKRLGGNGIGFEASSSGSNRLDFGLYFPVRDCSPTSHIIRVTMRNSTAFIVGSVKEKRRVIPSLVKMDCCPKPRNVHKRKVRLTSLWR